MGSGQNWEHEVGDLKATDTAAVARALDEILSLGVPRDLLDSIIRQLADLLVGNGDTERSLANLVRFLQASRSPQSWLALFEREPDGLRTLVTLFTSSQFASELLIADPEVFDMLRMTAGQPVELDVLQDEILAEVLAASDQRSVMRILRDYRRRETLRIAYGDIVHGQASDVVAQQLSILAESIVQAAVVAAEREIKDRMKVPQQPTGRPASFCVIGLGRLGGAELSYANEIQLLFVYEPLESRGLHSHPAQLRESQVDDYFQRIGLLAVKLLSQNTARGVAYHVDLRVRPSNSPGPVMVAYPTAIRHYDSSGRTWERQAFVKARCVAGDKNMGAALLSQLQTWIFRRYLMRADITGMAALKRRIERRIAQAGGEGDVKLARGGLVDVEIVTQFLQLLHGGESPNVRVSGTLSALEQLRDSAHVTPAQYSVLSDNYRFLRRIEHCAQIRGEADAPQPLENMDLIRAAALPADAASLNRLAQSVGYETSSNRSAADLLLAEISTRLSQNLQILNCLLSEAFVLTDPATPETDLLLDPQPPVEQIQSILAPHGFANPTEAYRHLQSLAVESIPFLSTRRCRHFLAAIAPQLLAAISRTPNPDATLVSLANVSDSLGGKAVLWELFSANPPSMDLCVRLCASSPYLTSILTSNPGMIDELLDSLMLDSLPTAEELASSLAELCRGASDIAPILYSFKNSMHLRVGVRDVLGKDPIQRTHAALSDIAEVILEQAIQHEFHRLVHQMGMPVRISPAGHDEAAELVVLAVGKLGGREPNYHSDLDVIFLFDGDGQTKSLVPNRRFEATTNRHFFNQLCQRVIQAVTRVDVGGRLYDMDVRLRPLGRSGELAITINDFRKYFSHGGGQVWERQALCKARPVWGSGIAQVTTMNCIREILSQGNWTPQLTQQVLEHRLELQRDSSRHNMKRGIGGTMDVEFVVQLLQLIHVKDHPQLLIPGTLDALRALQATQVLEAEVAEQLYADYEFLRRVESAIRLMNMSARHELPQSDRELQQLAFLMSASRNSPPMASSQIIPRCDQVRANCRRTFNAVFERYLPISDSA